MQSFSLFPPVLESQLPAVKWKANPQYGGYDVVTIQFKLSDQVVFDEIGHVQISIKEKATNNIAVNLNASPDQQVLYMQVRNAPAWGVPNSNKTIEMLEYDAETGICTLRVPFVCFADKNLLPNTEYNIQVRFGSDNLWCNTQTLTAGQHYQHSAIDPDTNYNWATFHTWHAIQANAGNFGEWSNVATVFCYKDCSLSLQLARNSFIPEFTCQYVCGDTLDTLEKIVVSYSYNYYGEYIEKSFVLDSGLNNMIQFHLPIAHIVKLNTMRVQAYTSKNIPLLAVYNDRENDVFKIDSTEFISNTAVFTNITDTLTDQEKADGILCFEYNPKQAQDYAIYRIDKQSLETVQLKTGHVSADSSVIIKDFSVEMGEDYIYTVVCNNDLKYIPCEGRLMRLDSILLTTRTHQLRLMGNIKLSGLKRNVAEGFQTTIGGQYPFYSRFSDINYRTFNFEGLVTILFDPTFTFFANDGEYGLRWQDNDNLVILNRDLYRIMEYSINSRRTSRHSIKNLDELNPEDTPGPLTVYDNYLRMHRQWFNDTSHSDEMIYTERKFREYVMNWLSDGKPKLFRSETEGNMIIMLTGVNFTPYDASGRMVYQMSATATEIAEYNVENLLKYNLMPIEITTFQYQDLQKPIDIYLSNVLFMDGENIRGGSTQYVFASYDTINPNIEERPTVDEYCQARNKDVENNIYELYTQQPLLFNLLLYGTYDELLPYFGTTVITLEDVILYYKKHITENNNTMQLVKQLLAQLIRNYVLDLNDFPELELDAMAAEFVDMVVNLTYWPLFQKFGFKISVWTLRSHLMQLAAATPEDTATQTQIATEIQAIKNLIDKYLSYTGSGAFPIDETVDDTALSPIWTSDYSSIVGDIVVWDRYKTGNAFVHFYSPIVVQTSDLDSNVVFENDLQPTQE